MNQNGPESMDELFGGKQDGLSEEEIQEQVREAREYLDYVEENPDEVLALGLVLAMNNDTTMLDDHDEVTDGIALRFMNPRGHQAYHDLSELLVDVEAFDQHLDRMKLLDRQNEGAQVMGVAGMLGGMGGPFG